MAETLDDCSEPTVTMVFLVAAVVVVDAVQGEHEGFHIVPSAVN